MFQQQITPRDAWHALLLMSFYTVSDAAMTSLGYYWDAPEMLVPLIVFAAGMFGLFYALRALFKDIDKTLATLLFATFVLFHFSTIMDYFKLSPGVALAIDLGALAAGVFAIARNTAAARILRMTMVAAAVTFSVFNVYKILEIGYIQRYNLAALPPKENLLVREHEYTAAEKAKFPDIYFIILDAYTSNRVMKDLFKYDNAPFLGFMRKNGFHIAERSMSSYSQTMLSVSSTLNLNYVQNDIKLPHGNYIDRRPLGDYFLHPRLLEFLKRLGYETDIVSSGYTLDPTFDAQKTDLRAPIFNVRIPVNLLGRTPLPLLLNLVFGPDRTFLNPYRDHYNHVNDIMAELTENAKTKSDSPKFVFAHILLPHSPLVFGENGEFKMGPYYAIPFSYEHGSLSDYLYPNGWYDFYRDAYVEQVKYINSQIEKMVSEGFTKKTGRPKVVFIQGDHGSKMVRPTGLVKDADFTEMFSNLNAVYFSDGNYSGVKDNTAAVNLMRLTVNRYFGFNLPPLERKQWASYWDKPYAYIDVTQYLNAKN